MKILDSMWFSEGRTSSPIGIVTTMDEVTKKLEMYIGTGTGVNQKNDEKSIVAWGAKFDPTVIAEFFNLSLSKYMEVLGKNS